MIRVFGYTRIHIYRLLIAILDGISLAIGGIMGLNC